MNFSLRGQTAPMHAGVNKERCRSHRFQCIYLWISVVRTIRQSFSEPRALGDSVGLLEYIWHVLGERRGDCATAAEANNTRSDTRKCDQQPSTPRRSLLPLLQWLAHFRGRAIGAAKDLARQTLKSRRRACGRLAAKESNDVSRKVCQLSAGTPRMASGTRGARTQRSRDVRPA